MFRALNAAAGMILFLVGGIGAFIVGCVQGPGNWDPNGFTVLLAVGAVMLGMDLFVEHRQAEGRSRPRSETDRDHMEVL